MPDWTTHILFALILCEAFRLKPKSLVCLGAIVPDILLKSLTPLSSLGLDSSVLYKAFTPFHTPIGSVLVAIGISTFIEIPIIRSTVLMIIGIASHFFLDIFQAHGVFGETMVLFPLSWKNYEIGWLSINHFYYFLAPMLVLYVTIIYAKRFRKH